MYSKYLISQLCSFNRYGSFLMVTMTEIKLNKITTNLSPGVECEKRNLVSLELVF